MEAEEEVQDATGQTRQEQAGAPESTPAVASSGTHSQSMEARIRAALELLISNGSSSAQRFSQELAILKRWYYRTHKVGEVFFAGVDGELPWRRIVRGVGRVYRGEKKLEAEQSPSDAVGENLNVET